MNIKKANKLNRNTLSRQERLTTMKKFFLFALTLSVSAWAADSLDERVDALSAQFERAVSKAGIHFNGEFRSQYLSSTVSENAVDDNQKKNEAAEYTSVDFDIVARPNNALSGRAVFRLHQDWRNFFGDVQNPITARWLSIDGSLMGGIVRYSFGDYKKKVSPLTLWSPDMEFLYEPEIFAMQRRFAMSESFLGGNNRLLQGMDLSFKAQLYPLLEEVEANVFASRLAATGNGESSVLPPGLMMPPLFDKYLVGVNAGSQIFKGLGVGITNIAIFDHKESFHGTEKAADAAAQSTNVFSGRFNADNRVFMETDFVKFGVDVEVALSSDRDAWLDGDAVKDSTIDGTALNAGLFARLALGDAGSVKLRTTFINNDSTFRNEAAQSPMFFQRRTPPGIDEPRGIMNSENSLGGLGWQNPFDAMYRTVFKHAPSQYHGHGQPYAKTAYNNAIVAQPYTTSPYNPDLNVFQQALPGGPASADRSGPIVNLDGLFLNNAISVGVKAAILETVGEYDVGENVKEKASFLEVIGGASVDIAKFVPVVGPSLVVGGSYGMYNAELGKMEGENTLLSGELNYNFYKRFSLLFGYQQLVMNAKDFEGKDCAEHTFTNLAAGIQYKVADGGVLTVRFNQLTGERAEFNGEPKLEYKAVQPEVFLTVTF
jgi:hypothetical protein